MCIYIYLNYNLRKICNGKLLTQKHAPGLNVAPPPYVSENQLHAKEITNNNYKNNRELLVE